MCMVDRFECITSLLQFGKQGVMFGVVQNDINDNIMVSQMNCHGVIYIINATKRVLIAAGIRCEGTL